MEQQSGTRPEAERCDLDLQPGTAMMVQFCGSQERHRAVYIGGESRSYLVVRLHEPEQIGQVPPAGGTVMVGCVRLGTVCAFESDLIAHAREPYPLLFLSCPQTVQTHKLRGMVRVSSDIPARARIAGRELRGRIVDLSTGGCRFSARTRAGMEPEIQAGDPVELSFVLLGGFGEQVVRGQVHACDEESGRLGVGVRFDQADPAIRDRIEIYVHSVLAFDQDEAA